MAELNRETKRKGDTSLGELFLAYRNEQNPAKKARYARDISNRLDRIEETLRSYERKLVGKGDSGKGRPGLGGPVEHVGARLSDVNEEEIAKLQDKSLNKRVLHTGRSAIVRAAVEYLIATLGDDYSSLSSDDAKAPHPVVAVLKEDDAACLRRISAAANISVSALIRVAVSTYAAKQLAESTEEVVDSQPTEPTESAEEVTDAQG